MGKRNFDFREFLVSLSSVPVKLKNKELAEILEVSDGVISKIRHGKINSLPVTLRPTAKAESFAKAVMEKFPSSASTLETFFIYARHLGEVYHLTPRLQQKIRLIEEAESSAEEEAQRADRYCGREIPDFLSSAYSEAYGNSSGGTAESRPVLHLHGTKESEKPSCETVLKNIEQGKYDRNKLRRIFELTGQELFQNSQFDTVLHEDLDSLFYGMIFKEKTKTKLDCSRRRETFSVRPLKGGTMEITRSVYILEQLILQPGESYEYVFQERLPGEGFLLAKDTLKEILEDFSCSIDNAPVESYIALHEDIHCGDIYDLFLERGIREEEEDFSYDSLELPVTIYSDKHSNIHRIEVQYKYHSVVPASIPYAEGFRLPLSCRFLEHEFEISKECRDKWGMQLQMFAPFYFRATVKSKSPVQQKRIYVNHSDASGGRVTFYDWALPGCGYSLYFYPLEESAREDADWTLAGSL